MVDLVQSMNEVIARSQRMPESGMKESQITAIKWKNSSIKFVKQIKTLEAAIRQKQKEADKLKMVTDRKHGSKNYGDGDADEMSSLIAPEYTGEGKASSKLKLRNKPSAQSETFEEFMQRRSKQISEITDSLEKINQLYHDLNSLALDQDQQLEALDNNMDQAQDAAKKVKKELRKAKPASL